MTTSSRNDHIKRNILHAFFVPFECVQTLCSCCVAKRHGKPEQKPRARCPRLVLCPKSTEKQAWKVAPLRSPAGNEDCLCAFSLTAPAPAPARPFQLPFCCSPLVLPAFPSALSSAESRRSLHVALPKVLKENSSTFSLWIQNQRGTWKSQNIRKKCREGFGKTPWPYPQHAQSSGGNRLPSTMACSIPPLRELGGLS